MNYNKLIASVPELTPFDMEVVKDNLIKLNNGFFLVTGPYMGEDKLTLFAVNEEEYIANQTEDKEFQWNKIDKETIIKHITAGAFADSPDAGHRIIKRAEVYVQTL